MIKLKIICLAIAMIFLVHGNLVYAKSPILEKVSQATYRGFLDNGLEYILIERHAAPVVAVIVMVKAGSHLEMEGMNGSSHFLEHLLFNGTTERTQQQIYDEMDAIGAYNNASTSEDYVNFMILAAREYIKEAMDVQADMIFNSNFPVEKFAKEKGIVEEEIGQNYNNPGYVSEIAFIRSAFAKTPYCRPVLGTPFSIENLSRQAVKAFYKKYYVPNNMILMAVGDFQPEKMIQEIDANYGSALPKEISNEKGVDFPGIAGQQFHHVFAHIKRSYLDIAFAAPQFGSDEFYAFELLAEILNSDGPLSLKNSLASKEKVYSLSCSFDFHPAFSDFRISAMHASDITGEELLQQIQKAFTQIADKSFSPKLINGIKLGILTENEINAERPHFYGMLKSQLLAVGGTKLFAGNEKLMQKVTVSQLTSAVKHLANTDYVAVSSVPFPEKKKAQDSTAVGKEIEKTLSNGLKVIIKEQKGSDIFALHLLAENRAQHEFPGKEGIADFMHNLLPRGTTRMNADRFSAAIEQIGAKLKVADNPYIPFDNYYTTPEFSFIRLECLDSQYSKALDLFSDMVLHPAFAPKEVKSVRQQQIDAIRRKSASASSLANRLFWNRIAPDFSMVKPISGTIKSIQSITVDDLRKFHDIYFAPDNLIISVVSALPADQVMKAIEKQFSSLKRNKTVNSGEEKIKFNRVAENVRVEENLGKMQSALVVGNVIENVKKQDRPALYIANAILSSRIAFQLREKEGLAYRIGSSVKFFDDSAVFSVRIGTRPDNLERAQNGIFEEINKLKTQPPDEKEVFKAVNEIRGRRLMRQLLSVGQAYLLGWGEFKWNDPHAYEKFTESLTKVTPADVKVAISNYLNLNAFVIAIAK